MNGYSPFFLPKNCYAIDNFVVGQVLSPQKKGVSFKFIKGRGGLIRGRTVGSHTYSQKGLSEWL